MTRNKGISSNLGWSALSIIYGSKGFGFVEMPAKDGAQSAINELNDTGLKGRTLKVNEARPRSERRQGGRGRGGGRQGGGRRFYETLIEDKA